MLFVLIAIILIAVIAKFPKKDSKVEDAILYVSFALLVVYLMLAPLGLLPVRYHMPVGEETIVAEEMYYNKAMNEYVFLDADEYSNFGDMYAQSYKKTTVNAEDLVIVTGSTLDEPMLFIANKKPVINFWNFGLVSTQKLYTLALPKGETIKYVR